MLLLNTLRPMSNCSSKKEVLVLSIDELVEGVLNKKRRHIARLISLIEDEDIQDSQFDRLTIKIASGDVIKNQWSRGEIKKPETINYTTFKPEKGGLISEKIVGPVTDWRCACRRYKQLKYKGNVCDRCGVDVTR